MRVEFRPFGEGGRRADSKKDAFLEEPPWGRWAWLGRPSRRDRGGPAAVTGEARLARPEGPGDRIRGKKLIQRENHETVLSWDSQFCGSLQSLRVVTTIHELL